MWNEYSVVLISPYFRVHEIKSFQQQSFSNNPVSVLKINQQDGLASKYSL